MITIITASWGNEDKTAAIVNTTEVGHKAISERDTPQAWDDFLAWQADGGKVRALEDGTAFKIEAVKREEQAALRVSALAKLRTLGLTVEELRALL